MFVVNHNRSINRLSLGNDAQQHFHPCKSYNLDGNCTNWDDCLMYGLFFIADMVALGRGSTTFKHNPFDGSSTDISNYALAFYAGLWAYTGSPMDCHA